MIHKIILFSFIVIIIMILWYYLYQKFYWTSFTIWMKKRQAKKLYDMLNQM